jgi:hypothetical protein
MQKPLSTGRHRQRQPDHPEARSVRALCEWYWARYRSLQVAVPAVASAVSA